MFNFKRFGLFLMLNIKLRIKNIQIQIFFKTKMKYLMLPDDLYPEFYVIYLKTLEI
jgi:hypothetical protein